jgi:hypothetical protein
MPRELSDWLALRSEVWFNAGCPKWPVERYAAFFFELDAWSEYWDLYQPETRGRYYFGDCSDPGYLSTFLPSPRQTRSPVFDAWKAQAIATRDPVAGPATRVAFEAAVGARPAIAEAVIEVDALVCRLVRQHFDTGNGSLDREVYFDAIERFARNLLPESPGRYARVPEHDYRKATSRHHTMEGDIMWFAWATQLDIAQLVAPASGAELELRTLLMAGVALGCSMDYAFSGRCRVRREYQPADAVAWSRIWQAASECASDFDAAAREVRELFLIRAFGDG